MNKLSKLKNKTLLVVEDDRSSRLLIKHFLESFEINVVDADSGEAALKVLEDHSVEGMLLDIALGAGIDGIDLGKKIKSSGTYAEAPMIAVTAYEKGKLGNFEAEGFTGYLQKPYNSDQLRALLESQNFGKKKLLL